ncbi:MAG TPA: hypothetical protein ENN33_04870 [Ignavibacteria bacterium]|nr:hypothetical protein [Ignavibacteria bacterium]
MIKQYIRVYKNMRLQFHWGLFVNMLFKDKSYREIVHRDIYYEYTPELQNYPYDYYTIADYESGSYKGSFLYSGMGFGVIWSRAEFEFRYNRKHIRWVDYVKVNEMLETYQMLFGFKL